MVSEEAAMNYSWAELPLRKGHIGLYVWVHSMVIWLLPFILTIICAHAAQGVYTYREGLYNAIAACNVSSAG